MAIERDQSDLPPGDRRQGNVPDRNPRYARQLASAWASHVDREDRAFAVEGTRFRHSWAAKCARELGYLMTGVEPTEPFDEASYWTFGLGQRVHELWQDVLLEAFPGAEVEIEVKCELPEMQSSGHVDARVVQHLEVPDAKDWTVSLELKTINGFGFKRAVGARGEAEGPRSSAIVQGALNAKALDADEAVIVYLSLENLSPREATQQGMTEPWMRFCAEWSYPRAEYEEIANAEIARVNAVYALVDAGQLPPRAIPGYPKGMRIQNPATGLWTVERDGQVVQSGTAWQCGYCNFRTHCASIA